MSSKPNKTVIGAFVVGAAALAVAGVIVFGGGKFFSDTTTWVMYFDGSVKGLSEGAPVLIKGAKIGSVTDIALEFDFETLSFRTKVLAETYGRVSPVGGEEAVRRFAEEKGVSEEELKVTLIQELIQRGLKARLDVQSMVTGQLMVSLDFHTGEPAKLVGGDPRYPEIPTLHTAMEELTQSLQDIPFKQILNDLSKTMRGIEEIVNSTEIKESIAAFHETMDEMKQLVENASDTIGPLETDAPELVAEARKLVRTLDEKIAPLAASIEETVADTRQLVKNLDEKVGPLSASIEGTLDDARKMVNNADGQLGETLAAARESIAQTNRTLAAIQKAVSEDSPLYVQISDALAALSASGRSIDAVAEYLGRYPEALLKGKSDE